MEFLFYQFARPRLIPESQTPNLVGPAPKLLGAVEAL